MSLAGYCRRVLAVFLSISIIFSTTACSKKEEKKEPLDPNPEVIVENTEVENIETEAVLAEHITSEIYLEEIILVEDKITELLLEGETIEEVLLCQTIYVPEENFDEFAEHSQLAGLFGVDVDISSVLKKVTLGTGVIITLVVVKRAGLPEPIASAVVAAADKSLKFAGGGAAIGSLFGGLTGATDELDPSGRTSAVAGFAMAAVGLILAIVSLVAEAPSGGSTTITLAKGIKLVIAGISIIAATGTTGYSGYNAVKTFTATDSADIDWGNIDWEKVGVSAANKAIRNGADGYMWGALIGAVYGGAEGYDYYQKYHTPYTDYRSRIKQTPTNGNGGKWSGKRGESDFILDNPIELPDGTKITKMTYKNGVPDFSPYQKAQVKIPKMTNQRLGEGGNYEQADIALAEYWTKIKYNNQSWTGRDVEAYRTSHNLTWHEMSNMESMQLVPYEVNRIFTHYGGVAEYNAMIGQKGVSDFD